MSDSPSWSVRAANSSDRPLVEGLLLGAPWRHFHFDWIDALDLLGSSPFLLATSEGLPVACLACPPDPPEAAWLRVFAVASGYPPARAWEAMWPMAEGVAAGLGARQAAAVTVETWMRPLMRASGFAETNRVIFLEWRGRPQPGAGPIIPAPRPLRAEDLDALAALDQRAFGELWRYSEEMLRAAVRHASLATVLEVDGRVVGFQLSTISALGAHLARLTVDPSAQGMGYGTALVADVIQQIVNQGLDRLTVNTQADNAASLHLYRKVGFRQTRQSYPVHTLRLRPGG